MGNSYSDFIQKKDSFLFYGIEKQIKKNVNLHFYYYNLSMIFNLYVQII